MGADDGEADSAQQADELGVLQAIYGEEAVQLVDAHSFRIAVPDAATSPHLLMHIHLPAFYPSQQPPVMELSCNLVSRDVLAGVAGELEAMFVPGEVVLWNWIEHLRERWGSMAPPQQAEAAAGTADAAAAGSQEDADEALAAELQAAELLAEAGGGGGGGQQAQRQQQRGASSAVEDDEMARAAAEVVGSVMHGEPFTEKRSTFQAHLAPATSMGHVGALMELLMQNNKIRAASHNIMAYRIEQADKATFLQDHDDDGESAAGGRLLHLLQMVDARNVCVVVSRW